MKSYFFLIIGLFSLTACTDGFEETNANPNEPTSVGGDLLLRSVTFDIANVLVNETYGFNDIVAQYTANYEYNQLDIYNWTSDSRFWGLYQVLQNIKDIKQYGVDNALPNYEAVALIWETYCFSILTDAYGDVPFSAANQAEAGIYSPQYGAQSDIYAQLFDNLVRANSIIDESSSLSGDILYDGDMGKWRKFANSLRVRLLMRVSEVQDVSATLQAIVDAPDEFPVFESNDDNAIYYYSGVITNISPYSSGVAREYEYYLGVPTTHFIDALEQNDDPRIHEWLDYHEAEDGTLSYIGVAPCQDQGDIARPVDYCSKAASYFAEPSKINGILMTASELNFLLAEAAAKGIIAKDAKALYDNAVGLSFDQWGVQMPADFLTAKAPYEAGNLDNLYTQKWLALYHCGMESWFDWKRTGQPDFIQAGPGNVNNGLVPVRLMYPSLEQSVNAANYQAASQRIGGDNVNTRVWWDR